MRNSEIWFLISSTILNLISTTAKFKTQAISSEIFKNNTPRLATQNHKNQRPFCFRQPNMLARIISLLACIALPLTSQAGACQSNKQSIASDLYVDGNYRIFICGIEKCKLEAFSEGISIEAKNLGGNLTGCLATPIRKAENFYSGFFLLQNGKAKQQFIFFGSYLCRTKTIKNGHYIITGEERIGPENKERYIFSWNGRNYISITARRSYSSKKLRCQ